MFNLYNGRGTHQVLALRELVIRWGEHVREESGGSDGVQTAPWTQVSSLSRGFPVDVSWGEDTECTPRLIQGASLVSSMLGDGYTCVSTSRKIALVP